MKAESPLQLFSILLDRGWSEETCEKAALWNEKEPYVGQSAVTALPFQYCFGGEISSFDYSHRKHYFNIIDGIIIDLIRRELQDEDNAVTKRYDPDNCRVESNLTNMNRKYGDEVNILVENCKKK